MKDWHTTAFLLDELGTPEKAGVERWVGRDEDHLEELHERRAALTQIQGLLDAEPAPRVRPLRSKPWDVNDVAAPPAWTLWAVGAGLVAVALVTLSQWHDEQPAPVFIPTPPKVEAKASPTPPAAKPAATPVAARPAANKQANAPLPQRLTVRCVREGQPALDALVYVGRGTVAPDGQGGAAVTGLEKGAMVALSCVAGVATTRVQHRVAGGEETVYLTLRETPPLVKPTKTPAAPKRSRKVRKRERRGPAKLSVDAKPWAKCSVGGRGPKTTRFSIELTSGKYRVICSKGGQKKSRSVTLRRGRTTSVMFDFR